MKNTSEVNCGFEQYVKDTVNNGWVVVCQYYPPGNFKDEYGDNVMALNKSSNDDNESICNWSSSDKV